MPTAAPAARRCASSPSATRRGDGSTRRRRRPAPPVRSGRSAPRRSAAGASGAASTRPYLDRVRGYHATEPYAKAMRKRQVWVEPLFAEAKDWHGLRRFRLRGLEKVNGEALLIAAGQNLKRLLSRRAGGGDRSPAGRRESSCRLSHPCLSSPHDRRAPGRFVRTAARPCPAYALFQHAGPLPAPPRSWIDPTRRNQAH